MAANAFDSGASFRDFLASAARAAGSILPGVTPEEAAAVPSLLGSVGNFVNGVKYGTAPSAAPAVHPALVRAAAMAQPDNRVPVSPITGDSVAAYGQLSPAARAVLTNLNPAAVQAADKVNADKSAAALQGIPTWAQMMAGYAAGHGGNISLRAMDALAGAASKGAAAGSAARKQPSIADVAGAQALQLGNELFQAQAQQAQASGDKKAYLQAIMEHQDRLERLARARAIDPVTQYGLDSGGGN